MIDPTVFPGEAAIQLDASCWNGLAKVRLDDHAGLAGDSVRQDTFFGGKCYGNRGTPGEDPWFD